MEEKTPNKDKKNEIFHIIYSIVNKLKHHYTVNEHITNNKEIVIFKVSYEDKYAFLMDDDFHQRIQLIYTADLRDFTVPQVNELLKVVKDNGYNWKKVRKSEKSAGFLFGQPTNYNRSGTRTVKTIKNDEGTQNQEKISDLCYLNILRKLQSLFAVPQ